MRLAALALLLFGCAHSPPVQVASPPVVVAPAAPCLASQPPVLSGVSFVNGGTCPPGWTSCLSQESAVRLAAYLRAVRLWGDEAWVRCGK